MTEQFTVEEINLMCIFDTSSRERLAAAVTAAAADFDEPELIEIADNILRKLEKMSDTEFSALEFYPIYDDYEETEADE